MELTGEQIIPAPRDRVWAALNDIEVLARIVPGCERLDQVGDNEYEGTVKIGIQSIKGTYSGKIRIEDIQPPRHYRLVAAGRSANGVVDGADFLAWQRGFGAISAPPANGDANFDSVVNGADLAVWAEQFGSPATSSQPLAAPAVAAWYLAAGLCAAFKWVGIGVFALAALIARLWR